MSDILCGSTTTSGGTIITIPAGRSWRGRVSLSASVVVATGGGAVNASARVSVAGAGSDPVAGDYLRMDLQAPASVLGAVGTGDSGHTSTDMFVTAPAGNTVALVLNTTNTTAQSASANGTLA